MCSCGLYEEDLDHILWEYQNYEKERVDIIKQLRCKNLFLSIRIRALLSGSNVFVYKILFQFFKTCKINTCNVNVCMYVYRIAKKFLRS